MKRSTVLALLLASVIASISTHHTIVLLSTTEDGLTAAAIFGFIVAAASALGTGIAASLAAGKWKEEADAIASGWVVGISSFAISAAPISALRFLAGKTWEPKLIFLSTIAAFAVAALGMALAISALQRNDEAAAANASS
ncbi:MAG: hypothetical protein Q7R80_02065 [bacterium]|nr:hypothetical protein [bacterium]